MATTDFTTTILVDQTPKQVFDAINNVSAWWQGEVLGESKNLNDEFTYRFGSFHFSKQKLIEVIPEKKVVWLIIDSQLDFVKDKKEWNNTRIIFEIIPRGAKTELKFTHSGLVPKIECYGDCSNAWTQLVQQSLLSLILTGKGKDVF